MAISEKNLILVTGCPRSGTTFADKLLWNFPAIDSFSQPLPMLFVKLKAVFLKTIGFSGTQSTYPLSDQQFENDYDSEAFVKFLESFPLKREFVNSTLTEMANYSGQYYKPEDPLDCISSWNEGDVIQFIQHYFHSYPQKKHEHTGFIAFKEIAAEEYIPYCLSNNISVILIVRDPREVYLSLNKGNNKENTSSPRPLLWIARQWRKSIAYALQFACDPNFNLTRFETMITTPDSQCSEWAHWLKTDHPDMKKQIRGQDDQIWMKNTSFIDQKTPHYSLLTQEIRLLEALCFSEMQLMGYHTDVSMEEVGSILQDSIFDEANDRSALEKYLYRSSRRNEERSRWNHLTDQSSPFEREMFIFENAQLQLKKTLSTLNS